MANTGAKILLQILGPILFKVFINDWVVESPSLEILQSHLDMVLGNWLSVALLEQGVGPDDLQRSLPTSATL